MKCTAALSAVSNQLDFTPPHTQCVCCISSGTQPCWSARFKATNYLISSTILKEFPQLLPKRSSFFTLYLTYARFVLPDMNRIRDSIHALLSRSSKKDRKPDVVAVRRAREEQQPRTQTFSHSRSEERKNSATGAGFNVFQARIYTKGGGNDYHYSPVPVIRLPTFRIDPPDDIPFRLSVTELERYQPYTITPPAKDELRKPPLTIDTRQAAISKRVPPPSPPSSPDGQAAQGPSPTSEYQYESPTRAPPSPPITPRLMNNSPFLEASDDILIHIFSHLDSLPAMESLSLAHPRFRAILVSNKLFIHRGIVNNISAPAASLVELLKPSGTHTAKSYIESYASSLDVVHALKALIQSRCRYFLTLGKLDFLNDRAERAFDDALYNIWIFCILFRDRRESAERQMEWLRGFGSMELFDILETWQCLGVLLRPLADNTELARKYGIIQSRLPTNDSEVLSELGNNHLLFCGWKLREQRLIAPREYIEEWISYVQTQGLDTLLPIVEWAESEHIQRYTIVVGKGLNRWRRQHKTPYSLFLKDTASKVYRELSLAEKPKNMDTSPVGSWGPTTDF